MYVLQFEELVFEAGVKSMKTTKFIVPTIYTIQEKPLNCKIIGIIPYFPQIKALNYKLGDFKHI